ncbi:MULTISPECIES: hypothetical protein [unclassified Novosphingobium]|uniref:hypothetical protein n=1 Tax=unclassified Novosphingobium TaxID=2644732 RepID=UPI001358B090|nr:MULTISPECIES: hypothetical protein [unclassified Novosphingobium]
MIKYVHVISAGAMIISAAPVLSLRTNAKFLRVSHSVDSDDIIYDGRLKLGSIGLMADL